MGTRLIWLRTGIFAGSCERGNEPSGFIILGEFVDWLSDYQPLKKDSASRNKVYLLTLLHCYGVSKIIL